MKQQIANFRYRCDRVLTHSHPLLRKFLFDIHMLRDVTLTRVHTCANDDVSLYITTIFVSNSCAFACFNWGSSPERANEATAP